MSQPQCGVKPIDIATYNWVNISSGNNQASVDLSSKVLYGIHLRAISYEILTNVIRDMRSSITLLKDFGGIVDDDKNIFKTENVSNVDEYV